MSVPADRAVSPRDWIGDEAFPWPPTLGLRDGSLVSACFSVMQVSVGRTRNDAPYLRLQLADCHGSVEARMWDNVAPVADVIRPGTYVGVRGRIESYQDQRQLRIDELAILRVDLEDLVLFLPRSARAAEQMDAELAAIIESIDDAALRALVVATLGPDADAGQAFRLAPAAKQNHHAYLGGLVEHTLSVARVCDALAFHYGPAIDRDLLIAAALLHDIGKVREIGARAGFPYTDEGKLLGHIVIGMQMVADVARDVPGLPPGRLLLLQHLIASHQGRYEWHSPREPRTLEAIVLHYADDLDAKLHQAAALTDTVAVGWTAYDRGFGRDFLRHQPAPGPPDENAEPPRAERARRTPRRARKDTVADGHTDAPDPPGHAGAAPDPEHPDTLDLFEG
ncbi:MAG TPA: HD domain-containing protein [Longimicrobiales bacterium]|nr:HD domain-containing protein [Longimicrobiales bacterium]